MGAPKPRSSRRVPVISHLSRELLGVARESQRAEKNALRESRHAPAKSWLREAWKRQAAFHRSMKMDAVETACRDLEGFNPELRKQKKKRFQ